MQTLISIPQRGWSGRMDSLPLPFSYSFLFSLPSPSDILRRHSPRFAYASRGKNEHLL